MGKIRKFNENLSSWELKSKIENIIDSNIEDIPYEGTQVDKYGLQEGILDLVYELCPEYRPEGCGNTSPYHPE